MDNLNGFRHVPRDWRYREVPDWARSPVEGDACHRYCRWLAQHLRSRNFPMNEAQTRYAASWTDKTPAGIAIDLADALGYLVGIRDTLEEYARRDTPYAEVEQQERERWQEAYEADPEVTEPFEQWKTAEDDYRRICQETRESDALAEELPHADIGIRPLLALAVKQCATDSEAEQIVRFFYDTFQESSSK